MPGATNDPGGRAHPAFTSALAAFGICLVVCWVWIAGRSWFVGDDFVFLSQVRDPWDARRWLQVFLPFEGRSWWSYRPLGIEVFFYLGRRAFGLNATGFILASLLFHAGSAFLVYRVARQLAFDSRIAAVTALFGVCRTPSMTQVFWSSAFQHVSVRFFFLAAVSLFLAYLQNGRVRCQIASSAALVLALLCNELAATVPAVLFVLAFFSSESLSAPSRLRFALGRTLPQIAVAAIYLLLRLGLFGPPRVPLGGSYATTWGWHLLTNYTRYASLVLDGESVKLWLSVFLIVAPALFFLVRGERLRLRCLLGTDALCLAWIAVVMVPFVGFALPHDRFAIIMEPPVALLLGAQLQALWQIAGYKRARICEAALLLLLVAAIPYGVLRHRAVEPVGWSNLALRQVLDRQLKKLPREACVIIVYGGEGLAEPNAASLHEFRVGILPRVVYPNRRLKILYRDSRKAAQPGDEGCLELRLLPNLDVEPGDAPSGGGGRQGLTAKATATARPGS